jgi:hypothetical protein
MRSRGRVAVVLAVALAALISSGISLLPAGATTSLPQVVTGGFSTPGGAGFWLTYANGRVLPTGNAGLLGDPWDWGVPLNAPVVGGAATPTGRGYWVDAADGGVFAYGDARYLGSMGGSHLNQPVVSMSPTRTGKGYWLVAADGGVFTFGDARFEGSTGDLSLNQPIVGIATSASGRGYRLVARDGGIFTFGDAHYNGSLPSRGVHATDVVGMATTPARTGYWIARADGQVYAFGNAHAFGNYAASACDPVRAMISNPRAQGYRLVTVSGATIPFGNAPAGIHPTWTPFPCPPANQPALQGGAVTLGGRIGSLQLGVSTATDVIARVGAPEATAIGNTGVAFPDYQAFGYECSALPYGIPLVFQPDVHGPYCSTVYYLNTKTQTLAAFDTVSDRYATANGTTVGMTAAEAARREGQPPGIGCFDGIRLGNTEGYLGTTTSVEINISVGTAPTDTVSDLAAENSANQVGLLFC